MTLTKCDVILFKLIGKQFAEHLVSLKQLSG